MRKCGSDSRTQLVTEWILARPKPLQVLLCIGTFVLRIRVIEIDEATTIGECQFDGLARCCGRLRASARNLVIQCQICVDTGGPWNDEENIFSARTSVFVASRLEHCDYENLFFRCSCQQ